MVRIAEVIVKPGRRMIDEEAVKSMADSMSDVGQLQPIVINKEKELVGGLHRLEAAKRLGWSEIGCVICDLSEDQAELAEIDENFVRSDLSVVERGQLLEKRKALYERLHPETKKGGDRKSEKIKVQKLHFDSAPAFLDDAAKKYGMSRRSVALQLQIARNLAPETQEILKGINISQTNARKLSRLPPDQQIEAAKCIASGEIQSVDEYSSLRADQSACEEIHAAAESRDVPMPEGANANTLEDVSQQKKADACKPRDCEASSFESPTGVLRQEPAEIVRGEEVEPPRSTKQIIADIKRTDKSGKSTAEEFMGSISRFAAKFHKEIEWYDGDYYTEAYQQLTGEQLRFLHGQMDAISSHAMQLYHYVKGMVKNELQEKA